jgi:hypothetical protein
MVKKINFSTMYYMNKNTLKLKLEIFKHVSAPFQLILIYSQLMFNSVLTTFALCLFLC